MSVRNLHFNTSKRFGGRVHELEKVTNGRRESSRNLSRKISWKKLVSDLTLFEINLVNTRIRFDLENLKTTFLSFSLSSNCGKTSVGLVAAPHYLKKERKKKTWAALFPNDVAVVIPQQQQQQQHVGWQPQILEKKKHEAFFFSSTFFPPGSGGGGGY